MSNLFEEGNKQITENAFKTENISTETNKTEVTNAPINQNINKSKDILQNIKTVPLNDNSINIAVNNDQFAVASGNLKSMFENEQYKTLFREAESQNNSNDFLEMMGGFNQLRDMFINTAKWMDNPGNMFALSRFDRAVNNYYEKNKGWKFTPGGRKRRNMALAMKNTIEAYINGLSTEKREQYSTIKNAPDSEELLKYTQESIDNLTKPAKNMGSISENQKIIMNIGEQNANEGELTQFNEYQKLFKDILKLSKSKDLKKHLATTDSYLDFKKFLDINSAELSDSDKNYCMELKKWMSNPKQYGIKDEDDGQGGITMAHIRELQEYYTNYRMVQYVNVFANQIISDNIEGIRRSNSMSKKVKNQILDIERRAQSLIIGSDYFAGASMNSSGITDVAFREIRKNIEYNTASAEERAQKKTPPVYKGIKDTSIKISRKG